MHSISLENEQYLKILFDTVSEGMALNEIVFDQAGEMADYRILLVNEAFCSISGKKSTEVIGQLASEVYGMSREMIIGFWKSHLDKNETQISDFQHPVNGRWFSVSTSPFTDNRFATTFLDITNQKQSEEKMQRVMMALESTSEAIAISDARGNHIYHNKALSELFGYQTVEEVKEAGGGPAVIVDPKISEDMYSKIRNGGSWIGELNMKTRDGKIFPAYERANAILNSSGTIIGHIGIVTDLTGTKKAEEALRESESTNMAILSALPDLMFIMDQDGVYIDYHASDDRLFYVPPETFMGRTVNEVLPASVAEKFLNAFEKVTQTKQIQELLYSLDMPSGPGHFEARIAPMGQKRFLTIVRNITERQKLLDHLRESNDLNKSLMKTIPLGMDIVDQEGNVLFLSENFVKIFGSDAIGKKCWELYRDDKTQCDSCPLKKEIVIDETVSIDTCRVLDNKTFRISQTGMYFQGKKAMLEIFHDITQLKQNESELIAAKEKAEEGSRLKSAFLANMSHEIRTPMNAIVGFSDLMGQADEDEKEYFAGIIKRSSDQLLSVINDVIFLSRLQSEKLPVNQTSFNPGELIEDVIQMFELPESIRNLEVTANRAGLGETREIRSDVDKIRQILTILVSNALKFTQEGGVEVGYHLSDHAIEFSVTDTGCGIPEGEQDKIFDAFFRGQHAVTSAISGTGLGLSIARMLVELLGGTIGVQSHPGKGSRFFFTIPVLRSEHKSARPSNIHQGTLDLKHCVILIAEDEPDNFRYLEYLLTGKVMRIDHALNGAEALEMAAMKNYNLIFMDMKMPVMDGFEATRKLKQLYPDIPVIAQTAYASDEDKALAFEAGCNEILVKPIRKQDLMTMIGKFY